MTARASTDLGDSDKNEHDTCLPGGGSALAANWTDWLAARAPVRYVERIRSYQHFGRNTQSFLEFSYHLE